MNAICVGSVRPNNRRSSFSSYDNPPGTDREEPDVMALGTGVEVAACDYEDRYRSENGTSFAAPSVAATAALFRDYCGVDWSPRDIRASFVLAGFGRNAEGTNYSTPFTSIDHQDGGGTPDPKILQGICNPERLPDPSMQVQLGELNPMLASDPALPTEIDASTPVEPKFLHPLGAPSSGRAGDAIVAFKTSSSGAATIRVSMSWDGCPPSLSGLGRTSAVPDYDLFLLDKDTGTVVANSVSFDDNIEGFEIEVEQAGTYVLYYGHDRKGCNDAAQEPFTWVALTIGAVEWVDPSSL